MSFIESDGSSRSRGGKGPDVGSHAAHEVHSCAEICYNDDIDDDACDDDDG